MSRYEEKLEYCILEASQIQDKKTFQVTHKIKE